MSLKVAQPSIAKDSTHQDYGWILEKDKLNYREDDYYYTVGQPEKIQGWILHLSCRWTQVTDLLTAVISLLTEHPFKVVQDKEKARMLCNSSLAFYKLGKMLCIYPPSDQIAVALVKELLATTKDFKGCEVPTDFHLGGIVYTRYGSFNPKLLPNHTGQLERYIYDVNGELIKDNYSIPFKFPKGVPWPFGEIVAPKEQVPPTFLNNNYYIVSTLKHDTKGRVMKALSLKGLKIQTIVIKEAKHNVCVDENERDIKDRLFWQNILLNDFKNKIPVPKVYDFFRENGNAYLVMQHVKGKPLNMVISDIFQSSVWFALTFDKKLLLVEYLLKIVNTIGSLHDSGYLHLDITPVNFILDRRDRFIAIDLELTYSIHETFPDPPFGLGTHGFMSPEQLAAKKPEPKQDIYSLGALMIYFFTNLIPIKFKTNHLGLADDLYFFTKSKLVSNLIAACLSAKSEERPDINTIKSTIKSFRRKLSDSKHNSFNQLLQTPENTAIRNMVRGLINAHTDQVMAHPEKPWHSNASPDHDPLAKLQDVTKIGWYSGISGVMYVLAKAKIEGHDIEAVKKPYSVSLQYLHTNFIDKLTEVIPGLYYGAAGVACALAKGMEAGLLGFEYKVVIERCLKIPHNGFTVAYGAAGQGLATLHCMDLLEPQVSEHLLHQYAGVLLENQQKDGSWFTVIDEGTHTARYTGYSLGVAGICYFLAQYYEHYKEEQVGSALVKALRWLQKQSRKNKRGTYWFTSDRGKLSNPWLSSGGAGVALCFINAYKILGDPNYRKIAEEAFLNYPEFMVHSSFSLANGLAGLAEVYLMASRIFENERWQQRADFILNSLMHTSRRHDDLCYWMVEDNSAPTADLMVGNSGILHFLIKYLSPKASTLP